MLDDLFFHPLVNDDDKIVICDHTKRQRAKTVNLRFSVLLSSAGIYLSYYRREKKRKMICFIKRKNIAK